MHARHSMMLETVRFVTLRVSFATGHGERVPTTRRMGLPLDERVVPPHIASRELLDHGRLLGCVENALDERDLDEVQVSVLAPGCWCRVM